MGDQAHFMAQRSASHAKSLGITQRVTPLTTVWTGDMRARFSDFQVNEISEDGTVIHLRTIGLGSDEVQNAETNQQTNIEPKAEGGEPEAGQESTQNRPEKKEAEPERNVSAEDATALANLAGSKFSEELVELYKSGREGDNEKKKSVTSEPVDDRPKRGQIHQEVRRIFNSQIETSTDDAGAIIASWVPKKGGKKRQRGQRGPRERREDKPAGEYLHFTLFKENRDTMDAVNQIARFLKVKPQVVGYAGTKDRRASTVQRCSVRYMRARNLAGINGRLWGVSTGDYDYQAKPIYLGQLLGNEFVITMKNCQITGYDESTPTSQRVEALKAIVDPALAHMAEHGWINYFGHQRFGTHQVGTHEVGKLILGDKYEEAVNSLLQYDEDIAAKAEGGEVPEEASKRDDFARNQACMLFQTGKNVDKALQILPRRFAAEACIFRHLSRQGAQSRRDFTGALIHITRGLRSMYLHAYQSYVWNHAASKRWELFGDKVVKGDLVIAQAESTPLVSGQDQDGDDIVNPVDDDTDATVRARPLTEEEASSGQFTVYDIVLPTPGHDVVYPDNELGAFYETFMGAEENGSLDPHKMRRMRREFSMPGRYRKLMNRFLAQPSIEVRAYADDTEQMHPTDVDNIKASKRANSKRTRDSVSGEPAAKKAKAESEATGEAAAEADMPDAPALKTEPATSEDPATVRTAPPVAEATKVAAIVKFQLGRSAYATVALRELMGDPPEETSV